MDAFSIFRSRLDHWKLHRLPPLHAAAVRGDVAEITELIEHGTSVNTLDSAGRTPLHHAIAREQAAVASELLSRGADHHMFGWHHDLEEKRFKLMILLTDLDPTDQVMSYVLGSHVIYHPYSMYFRNRCTLDYCRERLGDIRIEQTIGRAGDVFVFDSNGAHRGNRRPDAAVRDAFFVVYDIDRSNAWGGDLVAQVPATTRDTGNDPLAWFAVSQKKWERTVTRTNPTWVENLPFLDRWR